MMYLPLISRVVISAGAAMVDRVDVRVEEQRRRYDPVSSGLPYLREAYKGCHFASAYYHMDPLQVEGPLKFRGSNVVVHMAISRRYHRRWPVPPISTLGL